MPATKTSQKTQTEQPFSMVHEGIRIPWAIISHKIKPEVAVKYFVAKFNKTEKQYKLTTEINHQAIIDDLMSEHHFISPVGDMIDKEYKNSDIELYSYCRGVYKPMGIHVIKSYCYKHIRSLVTKKNFEIIIDYIKSHTRRPNDEINTQHILTMKDCNYNWKTKETEPHSPDIYNTVSVPVAWDNPDEDLQPFQDFLEKVLLPDDIQSMYELIGYCLYYGNMSIRELFIFYGSQTACGKSVCANVISALLGENNVNSATLSELVEKQFASSMIVGKMLNVCPEEDQGRLPTSKIKAWTGQDRMNSERKGKDEISNVTTAKFIVLSNYLPNFKSTEESIFTRINVFNFPHSFKDNMDTELTNKLTRPEVLTAILKKSVDAFKKVEETGKFSNWKPIKTRETMVNTVSNSLRAFADIFIERGDSVDVMTKHELHLMYVDNFCKIIGPEARVIPKVTCGKLLPKVVDYVEDARKQKYDENGEKCGQERVWKFIKWRDPEKIKGDMRDLLHSMGKKYPENWEPPVGGYNPLPPEEDDDDGDGEGGLTGWLERDDRNQSERNRDFMDALRNHPDGLTVGSIVRNTGIEIERLNTIIKHYTDNGNIVKEDNVYKING